MAATLTYTTLGYFSCVNVVLGTLRPAWRRFINPPTAARPLRPSTLASAARSFPVLTPSPYPVLGNMISVDQGRWLNSSSRQIVRGGSSLRIQTRPRQRPGGPAPSSAKNGLWKQPEVAECACARSCPLPCLALETDPLRKRGKRQLWPAPLLGSALTIGILRVCVRGYVCFFPACKGFLVTTLHSLASRVAL